MMVGLMESSREKLAVTFLYIDIVGAVIGTREMQNRMRFLKFPVVRLRHLPWLVASLHQEGLPRTLGESTFNPTNICKQDLAFQ